MSLRILLRVLVADLTSPTIGIEADLKKPKEDVLKFLGKVTAGEVDYAVFMTAPGIFHFSLLLKGWALKKN